MTREEAITVLKAFMENPLFSEVHKAAFNIAIHDIKAYHDWNINNLILVNKDNYEPIEQEPTTKNDLSVDLVPRADVLKLMQDNWHTHNGDWAMQESMDDIRALPSVTPQESKSEWQKDHEILKAYSDGASEVLDKIRAEIEPTRKMYLEMNDIDWLNGCDYVLSVLDKYKAESENP